MLYIKRTKNGSKFSSDVSTFNNKDDLMFYINKYMLRNGERCNKQMNIDDMLRAINNNGYYHERITAKEAKQLTKND